MGAPPLILVAEDDPDQSELLCNSLIDEGYRVTALHGGNEVIPKAEQIHPDLVIMDIRMPGLNGTEVLQWFRNSAKFRTLPAILVSAYSSSSELESLISHGANSGFTKPFEMKEMLSEVRRLIGIRSAEPYNTPG